MPHDRGTGWRRAVDPYGRDIAIGPHGEEMHVFDAERWLLDVAADLEIDLGRHFLNQRPRGRPRRGNEATEKQLAFLADLGWRGKDAGLTKEKASELIEALLAHRAEREGREQ